MRIVTIFLVSLLLFLAPGGAWADARIEVTPKTTGRPWLGIVYEVKGMYDLITDVVVNSPAERAGLKEGDHIVAILRLASRSEKRWELDLKNGYILGVYPAQDREGDDTMVPFRMGDFYNHCKPGDRVLLIVYRDYGSFLSPKWTMLPIYATLEERR